MALRTQARFLAVAIFIFTPQLKNCRIKNICNHIKGIQNYLLSFNEPIDANFPLLQLARCLLHAPDDLQDLLDFFTLQLDAPRLVADNGLNLS